ncbi:MAG: NAD-dependent epimerase/dehydratase family protein [Thermodesulfobacteriota bacterium]
MLFGGTSFIGTHFARHLLQTKTAESIFLADVRPPEAGAWLEALQEMCRGGKARYVPLDVHSPIRHADLLKRADRVVNLAAVHREPGHAAHEYFTTNLLGAEHICAWAEHVGCNRIIFTVAFLPTGRRKKKKPKPPYLFRPHRMAPLNSRRKRFTSPGNAEGSAASC